MAATTVKLINPLASGKLVKFQVSYDTSWDAIEIIPFMGLGVLGVLELFDKLGVIRSIIYQDYKQDSKVKMEFC